MPLTDKECRNAKPGFKEYKIYDSLGLHLLVSPAGGRYWRYKYKYLGRERKLAFGVYPEVSLAEARDKRDKARKLLSEGIDPASAKRENRLKAALAAANTFEVVTREWHNRYKDRWTQIYRRDILHRMEMDIFPKMGKSPISTITPLELLQTLQKIEDRGAHEMARRALQYCSQVFQYAVITARCERNPAIELKGALKPMRRGHFAALSPEELPQFIKDLNSNEVRLFIQTRLAIRFMMLTFVRTGELIGAKWPEFDFENAEWYIPAERMKMKRPHIVPLSRQAIEILEKLKSLNGNREWVFTSVAKPRQHMSNNTILAHLHV
ncbi:MAG: integrase arm-type DNA-binding domain-containing protein [Alphaproteobacteria bacterium]|nr:integrase arm-type DNA-binding domain-containing protein [Alphaproteobacteria bacterium]